METAELVVLTEENLEREGCYCLRSKPKSSGYQGKNDWLTAKFIENLKYIKLMEDDKAAGFIEYIPIEYSSRVVFGENYHVIHCLWVNNTGKGYASRLIQTCIQDAQEHKKDGIVVVTNPDTSWTPSKEVFIKNGFEEVDRAPYGFELLVYKTGEAAIPYFPTNWSDRLRVFDDLTILRTQQCPFLDIATDNLATAATKLGIKANIIHLQSREQLLNLSPTPYGVYGVIYKQQLITYHRLTSHSAMKRLKELM
ncbi:GNAT family N-acetyltransferase [Ornithinibacillus scapharcae]|uniref:GNAT family N-acetyltransferase n=1 Tax=Ornithinibacillus scapharcae TaxID=1147159 RepID=UPI000225AD07|nr:GNAT family N-acetyltransferase [Ornithinibacillus scapharcae]